jgi:4-amino-4-deoxy-L-arabinose transferase-like glycosyltransferase
MGRRSILALRASREVLLLLAIILIGSFFRLYQLDIVPPGLSTDEAAAGVNAESVLDGNLQLFYHPYDEPVFVYASAAGVALFGPTVLGLHIASAIFGILAILGTYLLGRKLFSPQVALLAVAGLALSFWPVQTSRLGFRTIALPCIELFAFYFLWRALKGKLLRDFVLAGLLLALAIYTYPASRILLFIVAIFLLAVLIVRRWGLGNSRGLPVYAAAVALGLLPLAVYFSQHPENFAGRFEQASSVSAESSAISPGLIDSLTKTLGMFVVAGEPQWKYNLSGQPVFNPLWACLFVIGIILALRWFVKPEYLFLLLWFALGLLPGILTGEAPHNLRTIVSQPAAYFFPALALGGLLASLHCKEWRLSAIATAAVIVLIGLTAVGTFQDYFVRWANDPNVAELFYPDVARAMTFLRTFKPDEQVYLSAQYQDLITTMRNYFVWRQSMPLPRLFDAGQGIVLNNRNRRTVYVVPMSAPASSGVEAILSQGSLLREERAAEGQILYRAYAMQNLQIPQPGKTLDARFGDITELIGYNLDGTPQSGEPLAVTLYSQPLKQAGQEGEYKFFVHLVDSTGYLWSQAEGIGGDPAQWTSDETVLTSLALQIPPDAPPKEYHLEIGFYSLQRGRLPTLDSQNHISGTAANSGSFRLSQAADSRDVQNTATNRVNDLLVGDQLAIAGFDADELVDPGSSLRITLYWKPLARGSHDNLLRLTLLDGSGQVAARMQGELVDRLYPSTAWKPGRIVRNSYLLPVPAQLPAGNYKLMVDLLDRVSGETVGASLGLASVQLSSLTHRFTVPSIQNPLPTTLGDAVEFLGYDLAPSAKRGSQLPLTLYWRAKQPTPVSYTVFVHLIDKNNHVWAQRDRPPVNGQRPTTSWVAGEVLVDRFRIPVPEDMPPGPYLLEIGMYDPATLERLPLYTPTGERMEGDRLLIGNVIIAQP